ncbi:MAG: 1-hydroxycarotenoid 3,4-desaturase CrtD [Saprospiraceae bacterium]
MRAVVIGAGIGGIAAAIRTAKLGYNVTVFEASNGPGGKLSSFEQDGYRFDRGPSLFTMPQYVDQLFELCDERPTDHFQYTREEVVCRYFWDDADRLVAYADPDLFSAEAAKVFGVDAQLVRQALAASEKKYIASGKTFLEKPLHKLSTWLSKDVLSAMTQLGDMDLTSTMHEVNERQLKHPKLVQLFDRFATYNGSSPYEAPGILTVIPTFEHLIGTFLPKGGMFDITSSLVALAERQGVNFQFNSPVANVTHDRDRVTGIKLQSGESHDADLIVNNADVHFFYKELMPAAKQPTRTLNQERSTSAVIFYWGIRGDFDEIGLHNIFFANDYKSEFEALQAGSIADDFTVYVNSTAKYVAGEAPDGTENWFVMVNAPYDRGQDWEKELVRIRAHTIKKISEVLGKDLEAAIMTERTWTPPGIQADTGSHLGALYGTSSNSRWAAFFRHRNESKQFKNLFFVGGSVHPGGGVPLALLSAKIAADLMPQPE